MTVLNSGNGSPKTKPFEGQARFNSLIDLLTYFLMITMQKVATVRVGNCVFDIANRIKIIGEVNTDAPLQQ